MLFLTMVCMVVFAGLNTAQAYMVKPLLDKIFFEKDSFMLMLLPPTLVGLLVAKGMFQFFYSYMIEKVGLLIIKNLRVRLFGHILFQPLSFFYRNPTGELISRIMNDISLLQNTVSSAFVTVLRDLVSVIGLIAYVLYLDWKLTMLSFVFLPLTLLSITVFAKNYRRYSTRNQESMADSVAILHEALSGSRIVKAFGMESYEVGRFAKKLDEVILFALKETKLRSFSRPLMEVFGGIGIALIMWYGGNKVLVGESTPGTFFSFLTALIMFYAPIKNLSNVNSSVQQGAAAAERIYTFLDIKGEDMEAGGWSLPSPITQVEFKNVSFSYKDDRKVLTDINLTVKSGEIVAIVGASGGGKTTLVNLLPRFYELTDGVVMISGKDISTFRIPLLRSKIAMVSQETILFNDTVKNNIAYGGKENSDDQIIAAAESAYALDFINRLPQGFDTVIGESGALLSGGQRQRISIARALLKNAPILILDEATSALDTESEREVQKALDNLMANRTTFVIAHRLSTVKKADQIIVLEDGVIVERGTHEQLLAKKGSYERLYNMQ